MKRFDKKIENMIFRLRQSGISDERVLRAMSIVPRQRFISGALEFQAYDEKSLPIGFGQTISHPYTVARMTELLGVQAGDKVLEIGTGSGYQAAVLCEMGINLFSIEIKKPLAEKARNTLNSLGYKPALRLGNGTTGWPAYAPYKGIMITAGAAVLPEVLLTQLETGGRLLLPLGSREEQRLTLYKKLEQDVEVSFFNQFKFVPLLNNAN